MHPKAMKSTDNSSKLRKGAWGYDEDTLLRKCIEKYGEGKWHLVPRRAGLNRCRKSCRLRWLNYLRPTIKRGDFGEDEVDLMLRLHKLLGNRWSLIAGRLPGRTANDIKNYWNTNVHKKLTTTSDQKEVVKGGEELINRKQVSGHVVVKPLPRTLSKSTSIPCYHNPNNHMHSPSSREVLYNKITNNNNNNSVMINKTPLTATSVPDQDGTEWWKNLFAEIGIHGQEEGSVDGLSMAYASGLENLGSERGLIWKTDETTATAMEATRLLDEDSQGCWRDIWDMLDQN